jgi:D-arabinose 1-dehydrogenase-like Zn-dependent alcohol dehydrogenase
VVFDDEGFTSCWKATDRKKSEPKMRVAMYYSQSDIRIEEMPTPKIGDDEVLVAMRACGICGSDLMEWYLKNRVPLVLGHEPAGIIAALPIVIP